MSGQLKIIKGQEIELMSRQVPAEWIDYNGHMNVAYYLLAADNAFDVFLKHIGIDGDKVSRGAVSTFALENHIVYLREMLQGDPFTATFQLLDRDHKRFHYLINLHQTAGGYHAAAIEGISIFMDMVARKTTAAPAEIAEKLEETWEAHKDVPWPAYAGRKIGLRR